MKVFVCFAAVVAMASAGCPKYAVQDPFSLADFAGNWYRQYSVVEAREEGSCIKTTYTMDDITGELYANTSVTYSNGEKEEQITGLGLTNSSSTAGDLYTRLKFSWGDYLLPVSVLSTDYDTYAVLYSCREVKYSTALTESFWVMTRNRTMTSDVEQLVKDTVEALHASGDSPSYDSLLPANQENCS